MGMVPHIRVVDMARKDKTLLLEHVFDGRELHLDYAYATIKHIVELWGHPVNLQTNLMGKDIKIICDENKRVTRI